MLVQRDGQAMGTSFRIVVDDAHHHLLDDAVERLADWHRRWTRFDPDSEIGRLNQADGRPVVLSTDTAEVLAEAVDAWWRTGGRFDPTVHDALAASGYDRPFVQGPGPTGDAVPAPGPHDVEVDPATGVVVAPADVRFDLGGIGKGAAADRLADRLRADGATAVAVTIGGDSRVAGDPGDVLGWPVATEDGRPVGWLRAGGACVSTTSKRRWSAPNEERHHIVDPRTGRSTTGGVRDVAVAAATAAIAEVHATAAIVAGWPKAVDLLAESGLDGHVVSDDGEVRHFGDRTAFPSISTEAADGERRE